MLVSPFTFYRGAALVMAADLDTTPTPGLQTQLCGDAHLSNFGAYASPERRLVFDINDFDETLPGPFEWDVKRLAASFVVAGRDNGFTKKQSRRATLAAVESYRTAMRGFAAQPILTIWYTHLNMEEAVAEYKSTLTARKLKERKARIRAAEGALAKAHTRDSLQAMGKLTALVDGKRQITSNPPLVVRLDDMIDVEPDEVRGRVSTLVASYRKTLQSDRRRLLDHLPSSTLHTKWWEWAALEPGLGFCCSKAESRRKPFCCRPKRLDRRSSQAMRAYRSTATRESAWSPVNTLCRHRATSSSAGFARGRLAAGTRTITCGSYETGRYPRTSKT
jgi:hypothetical protein